MISEDKIALLPEEIQDKVRELIKKGKQIESVHKLEVEKKEAEFDSYNLDETLTDPYVCYLRNPDKKVMSLAISKLVDPFDSGQAIIANCWLGGDEEIRTDETIKPFAQLQAASLVKVHKGKLTQL